MTSRRPARPGRGLPARGDSAWRTAPARTDGRRTRYLPFRGPWIPDVGTRLDWLRRLTTLVLLADGFPGRLVDGRIVVHPMDGRYLLEALLDAQEERPRRRLHAAIARTAATIVGRAEDLDDALVLRYVDTASSMAGGAPHISGLPQAYYAVGLTRAARLLGDPALEGAADRFFAALVTPVSRGGALYDDEEGVALAQVPTRPRDLILNGWLSMLVSIHRYAELRGSAPARELFDANLPTLRRLLPRYDARALRLSRYGLTGPLELRLDVSAPEVEVRGLRIALSAGGELALPVRAGNRWTPRAHPADAARSPRRREGSIAVRDRSLRCTAVLTREGHPAPNRLRLHVVNPEPITLTTSAHVGRYDPATSSPVDRRWVRIDERRLDAGSSDVEVELPDRRVGIVAYPTHFTPGPDGGRVNAYHGTHIVRLRQLAAITGDRVLARWAARWAGYVAEWPDRTELRGGTCWTPEGDL